MTRARDLSNIGPSNQLGFKNFIINGNFDIWQRGTSGFGTSAVYNADRWWQSSGTTFAYSRGNTSPLAGSQYYMSLSSTTAPGALQQAIESSIVTKLAGQTVTLSYWIRSTTTTVPTTAITYSTSTDVLASQTTSISVTTSPGTALVANTWTKQTVTFTVPSSTVGLRISLAGASGSCTVDYSQIQLELGSVATPFEIKQYGQELALCQRYYYRVSAAATNDRLGLMGTGHGTTLCSVNGMLPVPMRAAPTLSFSNVNFWNGTSNYTFTSVATQRSTTYSAGADLNISTGNTAGQSLQVTASTAAGYWDATAEL